MNLKKYEELIYEENFEISQDRRDELGKYIKNLRQEKGFSMAQLSDLTGINVADLHKIEHGTKNKVNPFHLKSLAKAFSIDYKFFYKIVNFLEPKDFNSDINVHSKEELIKNLSTYYPKLNLEEILSSIENFSEDQLKDLLLFINFIKIKK